EEFAWPRGQTGIVEAPVVEMSVHAVEPGRDPAAARFEKSDTDLRMALAHPAPDHAHAHQHHFHRVRDDVAGAAPLEAIYADGRQAAVGSLVEPDREIQILRDRPKPSVIWVMDHLVIIGVRPQETAAKTELTPGEPHLLDREVDRLHWQHRDAE